MIQKDRAYVVAEIGINHNGDLDLAKKLIVGAKNSGADAVKFQKRTVDVVYTPEDLQRVRDTPFGTTNGDLKRHLEFDTKDYQELDELCTMLGIEWFASPWDEASVSFLAGFDVPYLKVASACITDCKLLRTMCDTGIPLLVSTGMCTLEMVQQAVRHIVDSGGHIACLYSCNSTYPTKVENINLNGIRTLQKEFPRIPIGYSGHEVGITTTAATVLFDVVSIERHITLAKSNWGTDQAASLDVAGFTRLVRDTRILEKALGSGDIEITDEEVAIAQKLRRVNDL